METPELIRILKGIPECHLRIIETAWEVTAKNGSIDKDKLGFHGIGLKEAIGEAQDYVSATKGAVQCLKIMALS